MDWPWDAPGNHGGTPIPAWYRAPRGSAGSGVRERGGAGPWPGQRILRPRVPGGPGGAAADNRRPT